MTTRLSFLALLVLLALIPFLDPTYVIRGRLRGETFYRSRPVSYWRKQIQDLSTDTQAALNLPNGEVVPLLSELLDDPNDQVRYFACNAIGIVGADAKSTLPQLITLLENPNKYDRRNAAIAMTSTVDEGSAEAVQPLIVAIQIDDPWLQKFCAISLGRIGAGANAAVPVLEELKNGKNATLNHLGKRSQDSDTIENAAGWAIERIRRNSHPTHGT